MLGQAASPFRWTAVVNSRWTVCRTGQARGYSQPRSHTGRKALMGEFALDARCRQTDAEVFRGLSGLANRRRLPGPVASPTGLAGIPHGTMAPRSLGFYKNFRSAKVFAVGLSESRTPI